MSCDYSLLVSQEWIGLDSISVLRLGTMAAFIKGLGMSGITKMALNLILLVGVSLSFFSFLG